MKSIKLYAAVILLPLLFPTGRLSAQSNEYITVGNYSSSSEGDVFPQGWEPLIFKNIKRQTRYTLYRDGGVVVVRAVSEASSSGLIRKIQINPQEYPVIQWRWKVSNIYQKGDVHRKEGDDYPARLYITFKYAPEDLGVFDRVKFEAARLLYGEYPPGGAITYIWESKSPIGTIVSNPYTDRVRMIVTESGESRLNQWVHEKRDIYQDYKKVFGKEPPFISGVAIMTDSDNTGESATAHYGDIIFRKYE